VLVLAALFAAWQGLANVNAAGLFPVGWKSES
jgi:hypothetical protein